MIYSRILAVAGLVTAVTATAAAQQATLTNTSRIAHTVEVQLTAAPAQLSLLPGKTTSGYAYNGVVPGPTLEVREGDRVVVHFTNDLPEATTVHWHGLHVPAEMDGSPFHLVEPGQTYDYVFTLPRGTAGTYWYHPHPHHKTGEQVAKGLYGVVIVRAADDPLPSLPEKIIVLWDNRFTEDGAIDLPDPASPQGRVDFENGREGNIMFVNGQVMPTVEIRSGEVQRWRIVNASAARAYRLAIPGHTFLHIGSDGGLFEKPVETSEIFLANSERAEVLVRGVAAPGTRVMLEDLPYDRYIPQTRPADWNKTRDLLTLQYTNESVKSSFRMPATLRAIPALDTAEVTVRRVISLSQGMINGKMMDMDRIDEHGSVGATEIWEIENLVGMDHPFHLHGFQFQVIDRNGVPEPFRRWKDTVNVPKHETARFIVRFDDFGGKWMFHCHILTHEDGGMMGVLQLK